ncbi:unnamed protein product [Effrenium voratum]|uniref:Uncharacterized protein n=1 Tax=Effrenium voratum TaxID=2562239 RepID=A0AA36NAA9_9DINO|nr:unnamed protein product [Effrenium voratum]CAJ1446710.1 unnamed protein product [Effrenium voratum]
MADKLFGTFSELKTEMQKFQEVYAVHEVHEGHWGTRCTKFAHSTCQECEGGFVKRNGGCASCASSSAWLDEDGLSCDQTMMSQPKAPTRRLPIWRRSHDFERPTLGIEIGDHSPTRAPHSATLSTRL